MARIELEPGRYLVEVGDDNRSWGASIINPDEIAFGAAGVGYELPGVHRWFDLTNEVIAQETGRADDRT